MVTDCLYAKYKMENLLVLDKDLDVNTVGNGYFNGSLFALPTRTFTTSTTANCNYSQVVDLTTGMHTVGEVRVK